MAVGRTIASVAATLMLGTLTISAQAPGRWVTGKFAPLPDLEEEYTATTANGRLYLIGGNRSGRPEWPRKVLEYDLAANTWSSKKPVPFPGDHMAAAESGGKINDWYRLPGMPTARHGVNLAAQGNRLHVIGGHLAFAATGGADLHSPANEVFEFNVNTGSR